MNDASKGLQRSALVMKISGLGLIVGLTGGLFLYPPGFLWGSHPTSFPNIGPPHPESPLHALHPYLFDFGILSSLLHGSVMFVQAFIYPNEHAHLWADVPICVRRGRDPLDLSPQSRAVRDLEGVMTTHGKQRFVSRGQKRERKWAFERRTR